MQLFPFKKKGQFCFLDAINMNMHIYAKSTGTGHTAFFKHYRLTGTRTGNGVYERRKSLQKL
jgi:hypothetical protein